MPSNKIADNENARLKMHLTIYKIENMFLFRIFAYIKKQSINCLLYIIKFHSVILFCVNVLKPIAFDPWHSYIYVVWLWNDVEYTLSELTLRHSVLMYFFVVLPFKSKTHWKHEWISDVHRVNSDKMEQEQNEQQKQIQFSNCRQYTR